MKYIYTTDNTNENDIIARRCMTVGCILLAPGALFLLYKAGEVLMAAILEAINKGEFGPVFFMLAVLGLILVITGIGFALDADSDDLDVRWFG